MSEKKTFFASLEPKSALLVGLLGGLLALGTIGFIVMGTIYLWGGEKDASKTDYGITKMEKPTAELFIMSYCPYGLQMQKAYLAAWKLLGSKADMSVKYVDYAMHGKKEVDENTRQYCIGKDQPTKLIAYLECFSGKDDYVACLKEAGVNESKVSSCVASTDKQFGITAKYDDQSSWLSGRYPIYPVHADLNEKYGVRGSPTLIINGVEAQVGRTSEAVKQAICAGFENAPAECSQTLTNVNFDSGFGWTTGSGATAAECK